MLKLPTKEIIERYNQLNEKMAQTSDTEEVIKLSKEHKKLHPQYELASKIEEFKKIVEENKQMLEEIDPSEEEMIEMTREETEDREQKIEELKEQLLTHLSPEDPRDDKDILLEIRAGAGGDESSLFAGEMLKMYSTFADQKNLKVKVVSTSPGTIGGYKEVIAEIRGEDAFAWFKYEGGVHRVQRVPETEKQGRVHTSTVSVAIMPLIEDNSEFKLDPDDVEVMIAMASGNGGQSVNTTYSAVKMRHKPTGIEAQSQDEKNQIQNRQKCMQVLTSRVFDHYEQERLAKEYEERKNQVGRANRSEKIRTYNFPQDRLTDHRYNKNWNQLPLIMSGEIDKVIEEIKKLEAEQELEKLNS